MDLWTHFTAILAVLLISAFASCETSWDLGDATETWDCDGGSPSVGPEKASLIDLGASADAGTWIVSNANGSITTSATVPGGIYTDLLRAGEIGDPYYGFNDKYTKWVSREDWTYKRTFEVYEDVLGKKDIVLVFDGLDTVATVLLNGVTVGSAENMFVRYVKHVKSALKEGENELEVRFESPVRYAADLASSYAGTYGYEVLPDCVPSEYQGECQVNMLRKMQASFSWNWGPAFPSVGIWKSVRLEAFSGPIIRDVKVTLNPIDLENLASTDWSVNLVAYLQAPTNALQNGTLSWRIDELSIEGSLDLIDLEPTGNMELMISVPFTVPSSSGVKLWWPNGYGDQNLYTLKLSYEDQESKEVNEFRPLKIGFRTARLVQEPIPGAYGLTFEFHVNNVRMFTKGSNWIPADVLPERVTLEGIRDLLESVKITHQNMMRVWGGGIYESDEFYEMTDELGIMIWQDFMFACAMYPVTPHYLDSVRQEVRTQVRRLYNHPSIVLWAGNNENEVALRHNWYGTNVDFELYKKDYVKLYVDTLREEVQIEDPFRPFVVSSPSNGVESEEEGFIAENPYEWGYGDIHFYSYRGDSWNWKTYPRARYASEYGYNSWSSFHALNATFPPEQLKWDSELMNHRQHYISGGQDDLKFEVEKYMVPPSDLNSLEGFKFFLYQIQVHQSMAVKVESEFYRRCMSSLKDSYGMTMGALYWQTNEIWPAASKASLEYGGRWKMLHYYAKKFFAPLLISPFVNDQQEMEVYIVSDLMENVRRLQLEATLVNLATGEEVEKELVDVEAPALYAGSVWKKSVKKHLTGATRENVEHLYYFRLFDDTGAQVTEPNFAFIGDFLQSVPAADFQILMVDGTAPDFDIEIASDLPALFVFLDAGDIPGYFSDNGFVFVPGMTETSLKFHCKDSSITAEQLQDAITVMTLADNPDFKTS